MSIYAAGDIFITLLLYYSKKAQACQSTTRIITDERLTFHPCKWYNLIYDTFEAPRPKHSTPTGAVLQ